MSTKEICDAVKKAVDKAIIWMADEHTVNQIEHWQSHAHRIMEDENYHTADDCDGFALTSAELLFERGIDRALIRIVYCETSEGGHLVCAVDDPDEDTTWVLDNNETRVVKWGSVNYRWISYMSYDNLGNWISF
jgi:predicted transglutaminase-like cysteine proteinase